MERALHVRGQGEHGARGGEGARGGGLRVAREQLPRHRQTRVLPVQAPGVELGVGGGVQAVLPSCQGHAPAALVKVSANFRSNLSQMLKHWNPPDTPGHPAGLLHGGQMRAPAEVSGAHLEYIDNIMMMTSRLTLRIKVKINVSSDNNTDHPQSGLEAPVQRRLGEAAVPGLRVGAGAGEV